MNKIHQVLTFLLIILLISPCVAQWLPGKGDDNLPPGYRTWTVHNLCHEHVLLALHYQTTEGRIITKGWYGIPPGQFIEIEMISEWIAYFARTQSKSHFWGDYSGNAQKCEADLNNNFEYIGCGTTHGVQKYNYKFISVAEEPHTELRCQ